MHKSLVSPSLVTQIRNGFKDFQVKTHVQIASELHDLNMEHGFDL